MSLERFFAFVTLISFFVFLWATIGFVKTKRADAVCLGNEYHAAEISLTYQDIHCIKYDERGNKTRVPLKEITS